MSDDAIAQVETKDNAPVDLIQHVRDCGIGASKAAMACMWAADEITRLRAELAASAERIEDLDRVNEQSIVAMRHALDDLTPPEDDATEDQDFAAAHLRAAMDAAVSVSAATRAREAS